MTGKTGKENILFNLSMISCESNKKLSNFEKKDCFQNNRGHAAKCYWLDDVVSVSSLVLLGS